MNPIKSSTQALKIIVSLSRPSKMPCYSYNIPARNCIKGSKLRKVKGSSCSSCYAMVGWYPARYKYLKQRLKAIRHPKWVDAMVHLIKSRKQDYFRWHDSGDLQGLWHLHKIVQVAKLTPDTKHWLPTIEYEMIQKYWELHGKIPMCELVPNLIIRLSGLMMDTKPPIKLARKLGVTVSAVSSNGIYTCPAMEQGHKCLDCRECWSKDNLLIIYKRQKTLSDHVTGNNYASPDYKRTTYRGLPPNSPVLK